MEILLELLSGYGNIPHMNEFMLLDLLKFHNVGIYTGASVAEVGTVTVQKGGETVGLPADTLITTVGYLCESGLYESLKDLDIPVYNMGNSGQVHLLCM